ncbi:MAG: hypothetical protein ACI3W5_00615 [Faecousia sp.]
MAKIFKKPRASTVIFYTLLLVVIVAFYLFMSGLMGKLKTHLENYQRSHINTQYRLVFEERFGDPDWGALYDEAGFEDTAFEDKQAFITYMEAKVGDRELICFLESNGTEGKKCPVYLGDEEIGAFYMVMEPEAEPETEPWYYKIPFAKSLVSKLKVQSWHYDGLTLNAPKRELSVTVTTEGDRIVYVNGVALGEDQLISTTSTKAEEYLPEGLHGMRRQSFYQDGFLVTPVVTVTDLNGNPIEMVEEAPGRYTEVFTQQESEENLEDFMISAAKTYCQYMITATDAYSLRSYFDTSSDAYKNIIHSERWMQAYSGYRFGDATISSFYRYSDDVVSARIIMNLYVKRSNGTEKTYPLDTTFLMQKNASGKYLIFDTNNMELQEAATLVRLRFYVDGELVESAMVDAASSQLTLPQVEVPEGKTFAGWYLSATDGSGNQTLSLIFLPKDGETTVYIPADTDLTAMDLQARFE